MAVVKRSERELQTWMTARVVPSETLPAIGARPGSFLRVVVTEGGVDDWAAYAHYDDMASHEVANHGYKLFRDDAVRLFPMFRPEHYRA